MVTATNAYHFILSIMAVPTASAIRPYLFGDDAGGERHAPSHDMFRRMRAEQHADGNVVSDVADEATNQWWEDVERNEHTVLLHFKALLYPQ